MSEEDKMFNFLSGLQPWAQVELRRQAVIDLPSAIVVSEKLVDYKYNSNLSQGKKNDGTGGNNQKGSQINTKKSVVVDYKYNSNPSQGHNSKKSTVRKKNNHKQPSLPKGGQNQEHKKKDGTGGNNQKGSQTNTKKEERFALKEIKPDQWVEVLDEVAELLEEFADTMSDELPKELPPRRAIDHKIELVPGAVPPAKAPNKMGPSELEELKKQLNEVVESGYMVPSKAPYGAPILFQKKSDGKLDLQAGYWKVQIAVGDEAKTTCVTKYKSFEFLVMHFGLTNAPATFCNLMNDVLYEFLDQFVVVYLDDIVIYNNSLEEHLQQLRKVLTKLREEKLYIKKEKCEFCRK
uniref:Reverse transcriptase domain-containing protein n=1 Tax=Cannabis sativa TaxID=3483 RepID=A0A803PJ25_CANSA